jgi:hypothetical protein
MDGATVLVVHERHIRRKTLQPAHCHNGSRPAKAYNQDDVTGFIRLNALRLKVAAKVHGAKRKTK